MLSMLEAYRGVLLGRGELSLPDALRAVELADRHGLELYSGISTLYAGQLYIQSGERERGINLLRMARSREHVLGDRHLVCLSEIELLLEEKSYANDKIGINGIAVELPEEQATVNIISGKSRENGFELLLDLPSPFLACRLADKCGFPKNRDLRKQLVQSRDQILKQLAAEDRQGYNAFFKASWNSFPEKELNLQTASSLFGKVSGWIQMYLEGETSLHSLAESLDLEEISQQKKPGMMQVPGRNLLFGRGPCIQEIAPFLEPVAAVVATKPVDNEPVTKKDALSGLIVGNSKKMKQIRFELEKIADENLPVLITGETGTGKELCAKAIHSGSRRKQSNFVPVDCGAIPENLIQKSHVSFNTVSPLQRETCTLHEAIRVHTKQTVESFGGNRLKAAKALKCDPKTLRKCLKE